MYARFQKVKTTRKARYFTSALAFALLLSLPGCGGGKKRVPTEKLPEGVLEYSITPYNDEVKFASLFLYEAMRLRKIADLHNQLVLRFDMKKGDPKELEKLLVKTVHAYQDAAVAAYRANDVAIGLGEIQKLPGYSPYKKLKNKKKKTAFAVPSGLWPDTWLPVAYAQTPYVVRSEVDYMTGNQKNHYSDGTTAIVSGNKQVGQRQVEDKQQYQAYQKSAVAEPMKVKAARYQVEDEIAAVRLQAQGKAQNEILEMQRKTANQNKAQKLQAWAKQQYSGSWAAPKESSDLIVKHGAKQIVEIYESFPQENNLRGLANALHIQGKTDYETYLKAYDVYKRSKEITGTVGTKSSKQVIQDEDTAYRALYVTAAAGKAAEAGIAITVFKSTGGMLGAADAGAKVADAVAWGYQAVNVVKTGDEDEHIAEIQKTTGVATTITGIGGIIKSKPGWEKGLGEAWDSYKGSHNVLEGMQNGTATLVQNLGVNTDTYDKVAATALIWNDLTDPEKKKERMQNKIESFQNIYGVQLEVQDDGSVNVRTTVTNDQDPQKNEKIEAATGLTEKEIKQEEKAIEKKEAPMTEQEIKQQIQAYENPAGTEQGAPPAEKTQETPQTGTEKGGSGVPSNDSGNISGEVSGEESGQISGEESGKESGTISTDKISGEESGKVAGEETRDKVSGEISGDDTQDKESGADSGSIDETPGSGEESGSEAAGNESGQPSGEVSGEPDSASTENANDPNDPNAPYAISKVIGASESTTYSSGGKTFTVRYTIVKKGDWMAIRFTDSGGNVDPYNISVVSYDAQTGRGVGSANGEKGPFHITGTPGSMRLHIMAEPKAE